MRKTDKSELILEVAARLKNSSGFFKETKKIGRGISKTEIKILNKKSSIETGREIGNYISLVFDDLLFYDVYAKDLLFKSTKSSISSLIKTNNISPKKILVVGLGNEKYACDSLGKKVVDKILITKPFLERDLFSRKKMAELYAISLGVYGTTGLESSKTIKSICQMLKPDLVIAIDSLVAGQPKTLAQSLQISDTKLLPGGGVGNNRQEVSENVLGVKVIAIGVPLVVKFNDKIDDLIVTPKDVEQKVDHLSKIIAKSINLCFCKLTEKEYMELTS